ncbi:hypothetical protein DYU05_17160 [Mucilaginibacter terrenus]|uniref:Uncharacterized protein n=1 Tax=Mucilaginibacter terrenus TaxID=2482727 RepID=A0A3E2NMY1_9SPHI|nr:hypothetical protein [Mucilaginibacter terrenus]RFZ82338.1 hypothetical protein DYU05_17160 [Mucilaginibacter terrenus]
MTVVSLSLVRRVAFIAVCCLLFCTCRQEGPPKAAFYYWRINFALNSGQQDLLKRTADNRLYLRFFDIKWDSRRQQVIPNASLRISTSLKNIDVTPVVFITNQAFLQTPLSNVDSLAYKSARLISLIASRNHINYKAVQIDCDWTDATREKYFTYLQALKKHAHCSLQVTIRLHQVKYRERTGVPPADRGVLMFYNMGKVGVGIQANSIYNEKDAARYLARIGSYPLQLDVALPVFSWTVQSRAGRIVNLYAKITRADLQGSANFIRVGQNDFKATTSFFFKGIYIKQNDTFKLEETNLNTLEEAAKQLSGKLAALPNRILIFYELSNIGPPAFTSNALNTIADHF